ncbi:MAG: NAD-dependent epimerase/dehydratase family protein [Desulfobaccales bacterium]
MADIATREGVIFLAGATGLAGTSILRYLLTNFPQARIRGTYFQTTPFLWDGRVDYLQADLTRRENCQRAMQGCRLAILAAANASGAGSAKAEPERQLTDNLVMDANLLEAAYREGVERIVFISTATVYQELAGHIREEDLDWNLDPPPAYLGVGWAKRAAEKLCQFWHEKYGLEVAIARAANIYGAYAKFDPARSNFIPAIIRKAVERIDPFVVWGSPEVARDVIYSEDFAKAITGLLYKKEIKFATFNVGSGKAATVGEVVRCSLRWAHHEPKEVIYDSSKPTTINLRVLDIDKIAKALDWQPMFSLEQGIKNTIEWWRENRQWWKK